MDEHMQEKMENWFVVHSQPKIVSRCLTFTASQKLTIKLYTVEHKTQNTTKNTRVELQSSNKKKLIIDKRFKTH